MDTKHYLRLLRTLALAALTAAATAACSDDTDTDREPLTPPDGADGIPVTFSANINPGSDANPAAAPDTRTILTPTTEGGFTVKWKGTDNNPTSGYDRILIWAVKDNTLTSQSAITYVPSTSDVSSELVPQNDQNKLTVPSADDWTFTAIYGEYGSGNGIADAMVSPLTQSVPDDTKHIAEADFSVATATQYVDADNEMPNIGLQFKHMLSAMQLHVTNATGEALTVREIRLSAAGGQIANYRAYNVAGENWQADQERKSDYLQLKITTPAALATGGTESQNFYMLFFPGYANTDMTITVITDRGEFTLTKTAPASPGFQAGKNYMTNIAIKSSGLQANETWRETIRTAEELKAFRERVNGGNTYQGKTIYLAANIDLANASWTPIGNSSNKFKGTFDGGGYSINGLNVNINEKYAGLFGYVDGGRVCNLRVKGNVTTTQNCAGGIAGELQNSSVENCIFDGTVNGSGHVGGIAGWSETNSRIAGCHTKGSILVGNNGGGIVGSNYGTVDNCYSQATVTASTRTSGGIAGANDQTGPSYGTVTHCYATGAISGVNSYGGSGGIVGVNSATLENCIALNPSITRTSGDKTYFGRITGSGSVNTCGAFKDMRFMDATTTRPFDNHTGTDGTNLNGIDGVTKSIYTLDYSFTEATATTPGWAFDAGATWTYLPWNPAFEKFSGIHPADYCISVPYHITSTLMN